MTKLRIIFICVTVIAILAGCQESPEEKIYRILEKTVSKEKEFNKQQKPLKELESQEKKIFDKIINLGMNDMDKIVKLSDSALENLAKRQERMDVEQESILSSKKEFSKMKPQINKIEAKKVKTEAIKLYHLMQERYKAHDQLYTAYNQGIDTNNKLYKMLKTENLSMDDLEKQIALTNQAYSEVLKMNKLFNDRTKEFNESKMEFYQDAHIKID
ncbi:YkyA family protein [Heyndrickxia sporothermodurans]|uniref:YkyA family protein n=1 Tax=Heyndrickxia sporothermodurans TaxID=46224 RepID=A0A150KWC4_9BACI|nr:YkyA family protein [Heyndrickxia sporothermodurans]KYD04411.1 hypothetical protein B4102_0443 [Heyndrickxia sporothermodurans]MBL5767710.1 YkyA family protein [Heyndrickxia sporothermodurans]MBL5771191.1 YkyA family protein [Heyndrickxia sporothermodurans]MBL5774908.1 YkyA family protein [Heyndrickxia sporothermodurans]MBL5778423.1 YkyA family protein [Heyndrickxia sporothermodurans]